MSRRDADLLDSRHGVVAVVVALSLLFLAPRLLLVLWREPFFDELYTLWISTKPLREITQALRVDSGPPLYYALVHALFLVTGAGVRAARVLSLVAGALSFAAILQARQLGSMRFAAALFLAAFPPAVLFQSDARAYSLCALFITIAAIALDAWISMQSRVQLAVATAMLILAAYSHFYGVLFLPLPFIIGLVARRRRDALDGALASVAAGVAFIPGFLLARIQPAAAIGWLAASPPRSFEALLSLGPAARYPYALFAPAPVALVTIALLLTAISVARTASSPRATRFAVMTLVPLLAAMAISLVRPIYFPMRFEAVLAAPLLLWIACALEVWPQRPRRILTVAIAAVAITACYGGVIEHLQRPLDPYHAAALFARSHVTDGTPILASGYLYLELATQREAVWNPRLEAFPPEQALHPGWRAVVAPRELERVLELFVSRTPSFVWIGEKGTAEWRLIRSRAQTQTIFGDGPAVVLRCRITR